jgi:uncharacterized protein (TIGR02284 family)
MANIPEKAFDLVQNLIEACRDSEQGYKDAAEKIGTADLRTFFLERSRERGQYAVELRNALQQFGKTDVSVRGTVAGNIRRLWMDLKANLGGGYQAILNSLEAAEDSVKTAYQEAMRAVDLPPALMSIIRTQAQNIFTAHDYVRNLRDRKAAA